jgi:hypothetical protein
MLRRIKMKVTTSVVVSETKTRLSCTGGLATQELPMKKISRLWFFIRVLLDKCTQSPYILKRVVEWNRSESNDIGFSPIGHHAIF